MSPDPQATSQCTATAPEAAAVRFDPAWRTATVLALARAIVQDRTFDVMPILADALEDAGCDNLFILEHCRHAATHESDCWVLTLILSAKPPGIYVPPPEPSVWREAAQQLGEWEPMQTERRKVLVVVRAFLIALVLGFLAEQFIIPTSEHFVRRHWLPILIAVVCTPIVMLLDIYLGLCREVYRNRRQGNSVNNDRSASR